MPGEMERGGHPMMRLRALGLSEAQQDQVFKLVHEQAPAMHEQMKQVAPLARGAAEALDGRALDEGRARQLADVQAKALATLAVMRAQTMSRVREILTPEQRARMDQSWSAAARDRADEAVALRGRCAGPGLATSAQSQVAGPPAWLRELDLSEASRSRCSRSSIGSRRSSASACRRRGARTRSSRTWRSP